MKLVSLTLEGYRQFRDYVKIDLPDGLIGICGPNGAGKSKLVEAIGYALFGPTGTLPDADTDSDVATMGQPTRPRPRVELVFRIGAQQYRVERGPRTVGLFAEPETEAQATSRSRVTAAVKRLLRLTPDTYQGTFVARQRDVAGLQGLGSGERRKLLNQLIGVAQVERAIALADKEVEGRGNAHTLARQGVRLTVDSAETALGAAREARESAALTLAARQETLNRAKTTRVEAERRAADVRTRAQRARDIRSGLEELARLRTTLEAQRDGAKRALADIAAKEEALRRAEATLGETKDAADILMAFEKLATVVRLTASLEQAQTELEGPLAARERERQALLTGIHSMETALANAAEELTSWQLRQARAAAATEQEVDRLKKLAYQQVTARNLGPTGRCEACGGLLEDRLDNVLSHLADEEASARTRLEAHEREAGLSEEKMKHFDDECTRIRGAIGEARRRLERDYGDVTGAIQARRREAAELGGQLDAARSEVPAAHRERSYSEGAHKDAAAAAARHQEALDTAADCRRLIDGRTEHEETRARAEKELDQAAERDRAARDELARTEPKPDEQARADADASREAEAETAAERQWRTAHGELAAADSAVAQADRDHRDAVAAAERVAAAAHRLHIAEQTRALLRQVLTDFTGEARPRLEELMREWLHPLLGKRFKSIRLAEDYSILADNGSGEHDISHFSGGEQTVLAIMLRAAVSLFCRERAGFDTGFLILDEVFGDQDPNRRQTLVQFLDEIKGHYHQVLVVNHIDDVTGQLDSILQVTPVDDNVSRVTMLR